MYTSPMNKVTRRSFVTTAATVTLVPASVLLRKSAARPTKAPKAASDPGSSDPLYGFFDAAEARFIEAACERLIPADVSGPRCARCRCSPLPGPATRRLLGRRRAVVVPQRTLATRNAVALRIQLPFAPAELFRSALRAINLGFEKRGTSFTELPCEAQDAFLLALESGEANLEGIPPSVFFDMLLTMTVEGFFSHPLYGGTRDRVACRMIGFPGAYAAAS